MSKNYGSHSELSIIEKLAVEMEPELAAIDKLLDDDELYKLIQHDFSKRYPKTLETGRDSSPVEVLLRLLTVKRLYSWTYRQTEWHVRDSLVMRWFCRIYWEAVPDYSTVDKWALTLRPQTLHAFNERVTELAKQLKVTRGHKLRTDGTVVETNIHYPTDSSLLADGVRVLSRTLKRAQAVVGEATNQAKQWFRDRSRSAKKQAHRIANATRQRSVAAKAQMKTAYQRLVTVTRATVRQAQTVVTTLKTTTNQSAQQLVETFETYLPRVEQALVQAVRRVFDKEAVPATEKLVSLFEAHTDIIRRKKPGKETEFGHKVWFDDVDGGIRVPSGCRWQVLAGNPAEDEQWAPAIDHHIEQFGRPPWQASADRGLYSAHNEPYATNKGIRRLILPMTGRKDDARRQHEHQPWFKRGRRFHAGVQGRISVLKSKHQRGRCLDHGADGFDKWVGWGIIANNFTHIGAILAA